MPFVHRKKKPVAFTGLDDSWFFTQISSNVIASSRRKTVYRGIVKDNSTANQRCAIAKLFKPGEMPMFLEELRMEYEQRSLGIGPSFFYSLAKPTESSQGANLVIVEEDLGFNLEKAVFDKESLEHKLIFPEKVDSEKIKLKLFFDVCTALYNLQSSGYCHRDLRLANVCARWPQDSKCPCDIRATPIDYELCTDDVRAREIPAAARRYYEALFPDYPVKTNAASALMMDLGYLAALWFELDTELPIYPPDMPMLDYSGIGARIYPDDEFNKLPDEEKRAENIYPLSEISNRLYRLFSSLPSSSISRSIVFYFRGPEGQLDVRPLSKSLDIDDLGDYLDSCSRQFDDPDASETNDYAGIINISNTAWSDDVKKHVAGRTSHAGYVDKTDILNLKADIMFVLEQSANDDAPRAYTKSNFQPKSHRLRILAFPHFMSLIGCRMKLAAECSESDVVVKSFTESEVELLARAEHRRWMAERESEGYAFGDGSGKTSICLVPWDQLSDEPGTEQQKGKDYNRDAFRGEKLRSLLEYFASRGIVIVREQD